MPSAAVTISGNTVVQGGTSLQVGPITLNTSAPIGENLTQVLSNGDNSFTIPSGATLVLVQLPAANAIATKLVGGTGGSATGVSLVPAGGVALFQPATGQTSFVLNAASGHTAGQYTVVTII